MKNKIITVIFFIAIITVALCSLTPSEEKPEAPPIDSTLYVQSNLPGICGATVFETAGDTKKYFFHRVQSDVLYKLLISLHPPYDFWIPATNRSRM
jgi:hypothetical protein